MAVSLLQLLRKTVRPDQDTERTKTCVARAISCLFWLKPRLPHSPRRLHVASVTWRVAKQHRGRPSPSPRESRTPSACWLPCASGRERSGSKSPPHPRSATCSCVPNGDAVAKCFSNPDRGHGSRGARVVTLGATQADRRARASTLQVARRRCAPSATTTTSARAPASTGATARRTRPSQRRKCRARHRSPPAR
jgi:hypothetical protein